MPSPEIALDLVDETASTRPQRPFDNAKVWTGADLSPADWLVELQPQALAELAELVAGLRLQKLPLHMLRPELFDLDATRAAMTMARQRAFDGRGFAIVDRLPLDDWSDEEARAVHWLLLCMVSNPVAQSAGGQIFRDIKDTPDQDRRVFDKGLTQERLTFHTDNSGNRNIPNFTTLLTLHGALEGGLSEYCTIYSLFNAMLEDAPDQLERLFQPFYHNRQGIQIPGEPDLIWAPAIGYDGQRLLSRLSLNKIPSGYERAGEELDNLGRDALETAIATIRRRSLSAQYMLERGQLLIFNNREGLHHREPFKNGPTLQTQRHLVRVWLRDDGRPFFDG
ncbi:MAG: TauD/TfdA family dioxygenase [Gammaproteobacteria bacterium]|nr:TauD/TfdA family dioxygenase [Gammaproteobacteria bacterium]